MKEYKVISWKPRPTDNNQRLEDALNQYAKQGWRAIHIHVSSPSIVFETDKNR